MHERARVGKVGKSIATGLAVLLTALPHWASAQDTSDPCALLARKSDAAGYDTGVGRRWTVEEPLEVRLYADVLGADALPEINISSKLYDRAKEVVGGDDKLPSLWADAIDVDAELARLFGGRKFNGAFHDIDVMDSTTGIRVPMQPERLVITQAGGTMHCTIWTTLVAEGDHWTVDTPTVGEDEAHDNCYQGGSVLKLGDGYYIVHAESAETINLVGLGDAPDCRTEIGFQQSYTLAPVAVGDDPALSKALGDDLVAILAALQGAAGGNTLAAKFTPELPPPGFDEIFEEDDEVAAEKGGAPLPSILDREIEPNADPRLRAVRFSVGSGSAAPDSEQARWAEALSTIPVPNESWNELEGVSVQFFGYRDRHFAWATGTPHIGWRERTLPGFAVYEIVGGKLVPRLGGHGNYILQYAGARP